jgi:hypothetical protein
LETAPRRVETQSKQGHLTAPLCFEIGKGAAFPHTTTAHAFFYCWQRSASSKEYIKDVDLFKSQFLSPRFDGVLRPVRIVFIKTDFFP